MYIAGYNRVRDEFRRRRFELDGRAFRNEDSDDLFPGSGDSLSTEENDEIEPSEEVAPVLGVPIYSPDLFPGQVVGYPIHSLVLVPGHHGGPSTRILPSTLGLNPETALMFIQAYILTRLCLVIAFHALFSATQDRFYPF